MMNKHMPPSTCSVCWHKVTSAQLHDDPFTSPQGDSWYCEIADNRLITKDIGNSTRCLWCPKYPVDTEYTYKVRNGKVYDENF